MQSQYENLAAANAAVRVFLGQYTAYLKAHTRHQVDQLAARMATAAGHAEAISSAAREAAGAGQAELQASEAGELARISAETFEARLSALRDRGSYKDHEKLAIRRDQLEKEARRLTADQARLARAKANVSGLQQEAGTVADRRAELGRAGDRQLQALATAAADGGLLADGEPADTGPDLPVTAKARVAARRDDVTQVRDCLGKVAEAEQVRRPAETELGKARKALEDRDRDCAAAQEGLAAARADVAEQLGGWASRWSGDQPLAIIDAAQAEALTAALDLIGEPDAPSLSDTSPR